MALSLGTNAVVVTRVHCIVIFIIRMYESTGRAIAVDRASASALVKVFKSLYLLNLWVEVVHMCPYVRYSSVCCTITASH